MAMPERFASLRLALQVRLYVWFGAIGALERLIVASIRGDGRPGGGAGASDQRPVLLALSADEFRGDIRCLREDGSFRVAELHSSILRKIVARFFPSTIGWHEIISSTIRPDLDANRRRLQAMLGKLLPRVHARLGVSAVISAHVHYSTDLDWGLVSQSQGTPYIVLHRENMYASENMERVVSARFRAMRMRFGGEHIIVHAEEVRNIFLSTGYATPDRVSALGCMRMDAFIRRIASEQAKQAVLRRRVALFPLSLSVGKTTERNRRLRPWFERLHVCLARLAASDPTIEVVMKPKSKWARTWRANLDAVFQKANIDPDKIPNLVIRDDLDVHDLMFSSAVIIGINTTTLIEAGLAGRYAVIPYLEELQDPYFDDWLKFGDAYDELLLARSEEQLLEEIRKGLAGEPLPDSVREAYRKLFARLVSSPAADATAKYVQQLRLSCGLGGGSAGAIVAN
jgi:hypothetical protein